MNAPPGFGRVGFGAGLRWLPAGAELLAAGLRPLSGVAALWLLISMIVVIPFIGHLVLALMTPLLTAGVLLAFDYSRKGKPFGATTLLAGWRDEHARGGLLGLGLWAIGGSFLAVVVLSVWLGSQIPQAELESAMGSPEALAELLSGHSIGPGLLFAAVVMAAVLATLYFAIPLVLFNRQPVWPALITSLRAVLSNWLAFLGLGVAVLAVGLGLGLILVLLVSVLSLALGQVGALISQVIFLIFTMLIQMLMAGAQYVAYCHVFGAPGNDSDDGDRRDSNADDDQFIA